MNKSIRKLLFIIVSMLVLSSISINVLAEPSVEISIINSEIEVDGTVIVPLMINNATGVGSVEVNITYDPSVVIPVSITNSDFDAPPLHTPMNTEFGYIIVNAMQFVTGLDGNIKIGDITLQAIGNEGCSSALNLENVTLHDMCMLDIPVNNIINGEIIICDKHNLPLAEVSIITPNSVYTGDAFDIIIYVNPSNTAIAGMQLDFEYNPRSVIINDIKEGNLFTQDGVYNTFSNMGTYDYGITKNIYSVILGPYSISTPGNFIIINATSVVPGNNIFNLSYVVISTPEGTAVESVIYNNTLISKEYPIYDLNKDKVINILDLIIVANHFGNII